MRTAGFTDLADPRARGVHDAHALLRQQLHLVHGRAKCGQDHHLTLLDAAEVLAKRCLLDEFHLESLGCLGLSGA